MRKVLADPSAERAVLSGLITYGDQVYVDVADLLSDDIFTVDSNQHIYLCIKNIFDKQTSPTLDIASIMSSAQELSIGHIFAHKEEVQHLKAICDFPVDIKNVRKFAGKIKKLEIARSIYGKMDHIKESMLDVTGSESVASILGIAEEQIYNLAETLSGEPESAPVSVSSNIEEYVEELSKQVVDQIGIPTGFPVYDQAIGGGLRRGTINVIAARPKTGKTLLADNMGYHIANKLNIPVLNMDTEMSKEDHIHKDLELQRRVVSANAITNKQRNIYSRPSIEHQQIQKRNRPIANATSNHGVNGRQNINDINSREYKLKPTTFIKVSEGFINNYLLISFKTKSI